MQERGGRQATGSMFTRTLQVPDEDRTWLGRGTARGGDRPYSPAVDGEAVAGTGGAQLDDRAWQGSQRMVVHTGVLNM